MGALYKNHPYNEHEFRRNLIKETNALKNAFESNLFNFDIYDAGYELEFQLLDEHMNPAFKNIELLNTINQAAYVPEVYQSVVEINSLPLMMKNRGLARTHHHLNLLYNKFKKVAQDKQLNLLSIGTLPTFTEKNIHDSLITPEWRYLTLNENICRLRNNHVKNIHIAGKEELLLPINCISLMGAICAFHIHLRIPDNKAAEYYNASLIASGPLIALSTNSPYLFGKELWHETRVPLFEQIINIPHKPHRVGFGKGYIKNYYELFEENLHFPSLLPFVNNNTSENFWHISLHNGTLWRWNRPVLGIDKNGKHHLRIENRVLPAGTSLLDDVANVAFYVGLVKALVDSQLDMEQRLPFGLMKSNFYNACKYGLEGQLYWMDRNILPADKLLKKIIIPFAMEGLKNCGMAHNDIKEYKDILEARVANKITGSIWQRAFIQKNGKDFHALLKTYYENQQKNISISEWEL